MLATTLLAAVTLAQTADTVRVRADNPPLWGPAPRLIEELRLGSLDGPPETAFGSVAYLAASTGGDFAIFDEGDTQIRRYDRDGRFLGSVGRKGSGPGEYKQVSGLAYLSDTLIAVWDPGNSRISLYRRDGAFHHQIAITRPVYFGQNTAVADTAGRFWIRVPLSAQGPGEGDIPTRYVAYNAEGTQVDSLPVPAEARPRGHFVLWSTDGARWDFPDEPLFALSPTGEAVLARSVVPGYVVGRRSRPALAVTRNAERLPLEGPERKQWEAWGEFMASRGGNRPIPLPRTKPYARDLLPDPAGRVWLEVYGPATSREPKPRGPGDTRPQLVLRDNTAYDIFSAEGRYLGHITFPKETVILTITRTTVWSLEHGSDGQEQVVRYRVPTRP